MAGSRTPLRLKPGLQPDTFTGCMYQAPFGTACLRRLPGSTGTKQRFGGYHCKRAFGNQRNRRGASRIRVYFFSPPAAPSSG